MTNSAAKYGVPAFVLPRIMGGTVNVDLRSNEGLIALFCHWRLIGEGK